jgi:hypothetical protein
VSHIQKLIDSLIEQRKNKIGVENLDLILTECLIAINIELGAIKKEIRDKTEDLKKEIKDKHE